ncbi:MAG: alpha/beta hydrolase [Haliscomenobacter sp.]|nr:alpha/beta hydrolase [Haliscomenobacter sp.]
MPLGIFIRDIPAEILEERYAYAEDSGFLTLQGMLVHYRRTGKGMPVLLLHGTGASLHTWEGWTKILAPYAELVSVDLPGFGLTGSKPDRDYSLQAYVRFLEEFTAALKLDSFYLAGNSLGGAIAWNYALTHPEQVRKLILLDAAGFPKQAKDPLAMRLAKMPLAASAMTRITPKSLVRKSLLDVYGDDAKVTPALVGRYFELLLHPGNREAFADRAKLAHALETARLSQLKIPVLIQWGALDTWIPSSDGERFKSLIPGAQLKIYPGLGHVPMEEDPAVTGKDALDFLFGPGLPALK